MAIQTLVSSTNGGSIDWRLPNTISFNGNSQIDQVDLLRGGNRTKMWEIPRSSITTGYVGSSKSAALTRSDSFFVDGGRYTTQNMEVSFPINTNALLPDTFNIQKLGFKLEWNGARKDSGKVMYVRFAFTTNGTAISDKIFYFNNTTEAENNPFFFAFGFDAIMGYEASEGTDFQYGTSYVTWPEILYFDLPYDVTQVTVGATVGMRTNDNNNGGGGFRLTLNNIN